jgi:hypothetical protein
MLVLKGNIPRFSWEPSTTMLTNRLKGTTEVSVSNQAGHLKHYCFQPSLPATTATRPTDPIFGSPGEPTICSEVLTRNNHHRPWWAKSGSP